MRFIQTIKNIWTIEELRKRLTVTFLLVVVYRLGCYVALPGINRTISSSFNRRHREA